MKCQVHKKDNIRCDKDAVVIEDNVEMCKQHHKTYLKNKTHQYGTCLDIEQKYNFTIKEYLINSKIRLEDLND